MGKCSRQIQLSSSLKEGTNLVMQCSRSASLTDCQSSQKSIQRELTCKGTFNTNHQHKLFLPLTPAKGTKMVGNSG